MSVHPFSSIDTMATVVHWQGSIITTTRYQQTNYVTIRSITDLSYTLEMDVIMGVRKSEEKVRKSEEKVRKSEREQTFLLYKFGQVGPVTNKITKYDQSRSHFA